MECVPPPCRLLRLALILGAVPFALQLPASGQTLRDPTAPQITLLAAVNSALEKHPLLLVGEREVDISRARKQQASGAFDGVWNANISQVRSSVALTALQKQQAQQAGLALDASRTTSMQYGGGFTQRLRNGVVINPNGGLVRTSDNLSNVNGLAQSSVSFDVLVPLLRGRGRTVVAAEETAAAFNVDAALADYNEVIAERILDAVTCYWQAVGARQLLALAIDAEARGRRLADETQQLVDAGRIPAAEMSQLRANVASREVERIAAEQDLLEARRALALAMGLRADEVARLPDLADGFPEPAAGEVARLDALNGTALAREALDRRGAYQAASRRVRVIDTLLPAARDGLRHQFDLQLGAGYTALQEGLSFNRLFSGWFYAPSGPNLTIGFQYSFAQGRNEAQGGLLETQAQAQEAVLRRDDLSRSITSGVATALAAVRGATVALERSRDAVTNYQRALDGEREKHKLGRSSMIDLLTVEDRLTDVLRAEARARVRHASAIAQLRFASGTFINPGDTTHVLTRETLVTVPTR